MKIRERRVAERGRFNCEQFARTRSMEDGTLDPAYKRLWGH